MEHEISRFILSLRRAYPFFGSLALFADYQFSTDIPLFSTNGRTIRINPEHFNTLSDKQRTGLLLHLLLHCALLHVVRRRTRNERLWDIASDIAVNNIILEKGVFPAPDQTVVDTRFAGRSTEEIYEDLTRQDITPSTSGSQLEQFDDARTVTSQSTISTPDHSHSVNPNNVSFNRDLVDESRTSPAYKTTSLEQHWRSAQHRAVTVDRLRAKGQGSTPAGFIREWDIARAPKVDWRTQLWRYAVKTPCDFSGFDRRLLHQGLYLEELTGESLKVDVAIDTSGSIDEVELGQFLAEVVSIRRAYQHINVRLYYVDAEVHGPYALDSTRPIPSPVGNGGTDFSAFFDATYQVDQSFEPPTCIYFTDGDGYFPSAPPKRTVLWIVTAGGASDSDFPFGTVTRLSYL